MRAFHYLFEFTRRPLVRRLEFAEFNLPMLRYFQVALNRYCIRHNRIYAFLGEVAAPDILVILADFFVRAGEISWTIVGGIYEDRLVVIFRNDGLRKNAGRLASRAFGRLGSAGGHLASARAEVPLEHTGMSPECPLGGVAGLPDPPGGTPRPAAGPHLRPGAGGPKEGRSRVDSQARSGPGFLCARAGTERRWRTGCKAVPPSLDLVKISAEFQGR